MGKTFSTALEELKEGKKICRQGWNGKGMYLCLQKGYPNGIAINKNTAEATGIPEGEEAKFLPYIMMKTADPGFVFVPWLASQTDLLSGDWMILTNGEGVSQSFSDPVDDNGGPE